MVNNLSRNKENELIMMSLYTCLTRVSIGDEFSVEETLEGVFEMPYEDIPVFSKEIIIKSLSHINEIIPVFQEHMPKWKFSRLNKVAQAILLMSYTNYKLVGDIDKVVVINTAVKLAKLYLDNDEYKFINAILDNVL
ncbi:MAG: transcription antitermination protein NusB [Bacilli bacterium]|nr:transcription antitermination protein NusB [Bacilli bacterium]